MKQRMIIANWKMQLPFNSATAFIQKYAAELSVCAQEKNCCIVICPSFETLSAIGKIIESYPAFFLGAQDCSAHEKGAYTGQVCALSLAQIGCRYCIIGHSECRTAGQTNTAIAAKAVHLVRQGITPIVCIGETQEEYHNKRTYTVLRDQLMCVIQALSVVPCNNHTLYIAYEPVWAIGTGKVPDSAYLTDIFAWLDDCVSKEGGFLPYSLLYGGSVAGDTAQALWDIPNNDGLLVGNASLDFQKLKNIVSWCG